MKTIKINAQTGQSVIAVGERLQNLDTYVKNKKKVIVTDENLNRIYHKEFPSWDIIEIGTGEGIKTLETVQSIYDQLIQLGVDRSSFIVGIGGGIVCDITGFVASTFMRGVDFGFVSTSLLSQVDASTGGKNGVNFHGYKNMVGIFNQPAFVICDTAMLKTLPESELLSGFAEIVKHGAIADRDYFEFLEKNVETALALDETVLEKMVHESVTIKAAVVEKDEKEKGERRKLNFGHTFGHALENTMGLSHGEAVSLGMVFAAELSVKRNLLKKEQAESLENLLQSIGLPTRISLDKKNNEFSLAPIPSIHPKPTARRATGGPGGAAPWRSPRRRPRRAAGGMQDVLDALKKDKKKAGSGIHFVLLESIGNAVIDEISIDVLMEVIHDMY